VIKVDDERLVYWIAFTNKRKCGSVQALLSRFDTAAVINNQPQAEWSVFVFKDRNPLFLPVLENAEIFLLQVTDRSISLISDIYMHFSKIDVHTKFERCILRPKQRHHQKRDEE